MSMRNLAAKAFTATSVIIGTAVTALVATAGAHAGHGRHVVAEEPIGERFVAEELVGESYHPVFEPGYELFGHQTYFEIAGPTLIDETPGRGNGGKGIGSVLTSGPNVMNAGSCVIDFNSADALLVQPGQAADHYANAPWYEACGDATTQITASVYEHLHLGFTDPDIGPCTNGWEELAGLFARIEWVDGEQVCHAIDYLTEERSAPWSHWGDEVISIRMYEGGQYTPFSLDQIRVGPVPVRICAQPFDVGPEDAKAAFPMPGAMAGAWCWDLDQEGLWDLSGFTDNSGHVTLTAAFGSSSPFSFDDLLIVDQS